MQKKKKRYIILIIIATVVLIADVIVFAMSAPSASGNRGDRGNVTESDEMPQMPEGSGDREEGEMPQMPEGMENGETNVQGRTQGFGIVRIICIVVGIICIIIDIICGVKLFKMSKKKDELVQIEGDEEAKKIVEQELDPVEERLRKQRKNKKIMMAAVAVLLVIVLILQLVTGRIKEGSSTTVQEEVVTAQAEMGDISQALKSSGVLAAATSEGIAVPGDITVTDYLVSNGDTVEAGDAIASVDKNSVMAAIADVQEMIDEVDAEISAQKDASISSSIKASCDGTVVAVYAEDDAEVIDVMYEKGALILISLDDLLAIEVENPGDVTVGDKVTVIDSDKNTYEGKVASIEKETIEVTVSLDNFNYKEKVTVKDSDGDTLGKGKLYVYSQQKITGYSGTISGVNVSKGDSVTEGTTLLTLSDTDYTAAYQILMNKRIALEDQYNRLVEVASTGYVYVKEAGTISGIDEGLLAASTESNTAYKAGLVYLTSGDVTGDGTTSDGTESDESASSNEAGDNTSSGCETDTNESAVISKSVNIVWMNSDGNVMTEGYPEKIEVELRADDKVIDTVEITAEDEWTYTWTGLSVVSEEGTEIKYTMTIKDPIEGFTTDTQVAGTVTVIINTKAAQAQGDSQGPTSQGNGENTQNNQNAQTDKNNQAQGQGTSRGQGGSTSGFSVSGSAGGAAGLTGAVTESVEEETESSYVFGETTLCSLTPDDGVVIEITIDELDILSISLEQECEITLDAFPGQSFEGVVTGIGQSGTNSGGNAKYTVTVSMNKESEMLLGMNASVKIIVDTENSVLCIPEEALIEQEGKVYVYTEYNEKDDELGGLTEVTTGLSDGQNVQILDGLSEGQEYYYRYADTISYSFVR